MIFFIYSILYLLSFIFTIGLILVLFKYRNKTKVDGAILFTFFIAAFWFLADFFTLKIFFNRELDLFFWRLSIFSSFLLTVSLLRSVMAIVNFEIKKVTTYVCYLIFLILSYVILFTNFVVVGVKPLLFTGGSNFVYGTGFIYLGILLILMIFYSLFLIIKKTQSLKKYTEKKPLILFAVGILFVFIIAGTSNIILPIFNVDFPRLAFLGIVSLLSITAYIIYKWNVFGFNITTLGIRNKIIFTMILASLVPILAISSYFYGNTSRVLEKEYLQEEIRDLEIKQSYIEDFLRSSKEDVLFLSQLSNLRNYINSNSEDGQVYKDYLANNFLNFSRQRGIYYQIRYLDETGQEIVRVDNNGQDIFIVDNDQLQNKKDRYYFSDSMNVNEGTVFISPLDLNVENNEIEIPYKPVIRYGTPVFNNKGETKGIVITNVDANKLLGIIDDDNDLRDTFLINKEGYFLNSPDKDMEWGFMLGQEEKNIKEIYPDIYESIIKDNELENQLHCYVGSCYISYRFIYPAGKFIIKDQNLSQNSDSSFTSYQNKDYYWILFSKVDKYVLSSIAETNLLYVYLIIILILLLTLIFSFILSRFIAKPISQLKESINVVTRGDLNHKVYVSSKDELRDLADDFNLMTKAIKKSRENVDKKVKIQTQQILENNEKLERQQSAVLNILEDVEDEKIRTENLAKDLEKFKLAVDNASDHIVITDETGACLYANDAVEKITGFKKEDLWGKKAGTKENWGGQMDKEFYDHLWKTIKQDKKVFEGYLKNKRKNGEQYDSLASVSPILDKHGHVKFFVGIERDMTEEKKIDRAKSEFVSLASHQLRTPLSTINWYAEMLLSEDAGKLTKEQKEFTGEIYKGNQRMVDLVNSLLNVSRIELGTLAVDPKETDLIEQANSVLDEIKPLINKKKLKVIKKFDKKTPKINLDDKLMRIVWQNLLSNALKYTPANGKITIIVGKDKTNAKIEVTDTGMGIPKKQQDKIFTKLFRADNVRERETDGTGLGLYIVKSVIDQFGGKIWFKSQENKGTSFFINIPLKGVKAKEGTKGLEYIK